MEIRIKHDKIKDSQKITEVTDRALKDNGFDIHRHEVTNLEDDFKKGERILQVKGERLYFTVPALPWHDDK